MKVCLLPTPLSLAPQDNKPIRPNPAKGQGPVWVCVCEKVCKCELDIKNSNRDSFCIIFLLLRNQDEDEDLYEEVIICEYFI